MKMIVPLTMTVFFTAFNSASAASLFLSSPSSIFEGRVWEDYHGANRFVINFEATAVNGDIYIKDGFDVNSNFYYGGSETNLELMPTSGEIREVTAFMYVFPTEYTGNYSYFVDGILYANPFLLIREGQTAEITFDVRATFTEDAVVKMTLDRFEWTDDLSGSSGHVTETEFQTPYLMVEGVPEPSSVFLWAGFLSLITTRRKRTE